MHPVILSLIASALVASATEPTLEPLAVLVAADGDGFEIVAYSDLTNEIWATRTGKPRLTRIDVSDTQAPRIVGDVTLETFGREVTSVAVHHNRVAATVLPNAPSDTGTVVILETTGELIAAHAVGFHPDMVCFANDGGLLLVANEGEPSENFDPPGSLSVFRLQAGEPTESIELLLGDESADPSAVVWTTPLAETPPTMVEPEYIAVDPHSSIAAVSCQENNGIVFVDLSVWPPALIDQTDLGLRTKSDMGPIDVSDDGVLGREEPISAGLPQPDGIAFVRNGTHLYVVTADEGDPRETWGADGAIEREGFQQALYTTEDGDPILFGTRSVSAWRTDGTLVASAKSPVAEWVESHPNTLREQTLDVRSDRRGEEPEGIVSFCRDRRAYVAVGFERVGAVGLFEFTGTAIRTLDMEFLMMGASAKRPSPEGLAVIDRPGSDPIIVVADERGGALTLLRVTTSHAIESNIAD